MISELYHTGRSTLLEEQRQRVPQLRLEDDQRRDGTELEEVFQQVLQQVELEDPDNADLPSSH